MSTEDTLSVQIIVFPERSELMFSSHIPDGEFQVLIFNGLDVETCEDWQPALVRKPLKRSVLQFESWLNVFTDGRDGLHELILF